jgi:hypothetical protein
MDHLLRRGSFGGGLDFALQNATPLLQSRENPLTIDAILNIDAQRSIVPEDRWCDAST